MEQPMSSEAWAWRTGLPRRLRLLLALLALCGLVACKTTTAATDSYCLIAKPIRDSILDTAETRQQVKEHNAQYVCVCLRDCPPEP